MTDATLCLTVTQPHCADQYIPCHGQGEKIEIWCDWHTSSNGSTDISKLLSVSKFIIVPAIEERSMNSKSRRPRFCDNKSPTLSIQTDGLKENRPER
jgi:hypothetical protein